MSKDTTSTGQQYSQATPYKLKAFRYLMSYHARVCELILKKTKQPYLYIDLNCGAGHQPEYKKFGPEQYGSPIIALQELNKRGIKPTCHFCDVSEEALSILERTIGEMGLQCQPFYWRGDNKKTLREISQKLSRSQFNGLVYSDPNGKQDFPIKEIKEIFQLFPMQRVDLLMNVATTYVKRWETNPKATWEVYSLEEITHGHGKKHIFVRDPDDDAMKWTFIYATNWKDQKNLKKIRLHGVTSELGERILENLFNPKSNPRPTFMNDGSVAIQGKFNFDVK